MTKEVLIQLRDDIDGKVGRTVSTREFSISGVAYELELSDGNWHKLQRAIAPFIDVARPATKKPRKKTTKKVADKKDAAPRNNDHTAVREWANQNGYHVKPIGRISPDVLAAYSAANP